MWYQWYLAAALGDLTRLQPVGWTCSIQGKLAAGQVQVSSSAVIYCLQRLRQSSLHLLDMPSQLKTGVLQCPSWIFWKEGPPLRTRHTISGTDADAARSYEHHMCRDVISVLPGLQCFSGWKFLHLEPNSANGIMYDGNVRSRPLACFLCYTLYFHCPERNHVQTIAIPCASRLHSKPIHFSWLTW